MHMTVRDMTTYTTGGLVAHHPGWVITPVGPSKDTHGTPGPARVKAVGGPNNTPVGEVTRYDASLKQDNRQVFRQTNFEELQNLFDITQKLILHHQAQILNVSKGTRLLRFRRMLGEDAKSFRSKPKMDGSTRWISTVQFLQRSFFWTDGEPIEFEWNVFPGLTSLEILQKIQEDLQDRKIEPEDFEDRIMSMLNDIEWTKRGKFRECYFKFRTSQELREEMLARTLDIPRSWRRKEMVCDSVVHVKENGIPQPQRWWNDWEKLVTQHSRVSVLRVVEFWKGRITKTPYTSMRMLRTQNSCFERFTQQISSVSTEQSQTGV